VARALELAGCRNVRSSWVECRSDGLMIENMVMFYDEVRDRLEALNLMSLAEVEEQQRLLHTLALDQLPPIWAVYRVTAEA
jgi:hypothetical protein